MKNQIRMILNIFIFINFILPSNGFSKNLSVPVLAENVNLREKPSINSNVVFQLPIAIDVVILHKSGDKVTINGLSGEWVYVDTNIRINNTTNETIKGWIFDYYLGYKEKFFRVMKWKKQTFTYTAGDYTPVFEIQENGTFSYSYNLCSLTDCNNKNLKCMRTSEILNKNSCYGKGFLYRYGKIMSFRDVNGNVIVNVIIENNELVYYE